MHPSQSSQIQQVPIQLSSSQYETDTHQNGDNICLFSTHTTRISLWRFRWLACTSILAFSPPMLYFILN